MFKQFYGLFAAIFKLMTFCNRVAFNLFILLKFAFYGVNYDSFTRVRWGEGWGEG